MKRVMSHEARQVPSWLIFDVGRKKMFAAIANALKARRYEAEVCRSAWSAFETAYPERKIKKKLAV
jgi:hypothetical protein